MYLFRARKSRYQHREGEDAGACSKAASVAFKSTVVETESFGLKVEMTFKREEVRTSEFLASKLFKR